MASPDRSWTIAPVLLWFVGLLGVAVVLLDGGAGALADRFRPRHTSEAAAGGPPFGSRPVEVAESPEAEGPTESLAGGGGDAAAAIDADRRKILALEDHCLDGAIEPCKAWAMDAFYRAVADTRRGALGRALRVSWYGDSVIATDAVPGRLRTRLQDELGNGGPGFIYAVPPHRFCGHDAIARSSAGAWTVHSISTTLLADGMYGPGGSTAEVDDGRATIKLLAGRASQIDLYYLSQPRGGSVAIVADGAPVATVETRGAKQPGFTAASVDGGAEKFELAAHGRVRLFGVALENPSGAVVDNLGVVSVNLKSFDANLPEHFQAELAHRAADLVMIMVGANEAQWLAPRDHDTRDYQLRYGKLLAQFRAARPSASCLVVSPTDQAEERDGAYASRPVMPVLVEAQRRAAADQGCAFYSTYDWMGGKGSASRWFHKGLVGTDFQHLSRKGADRLSDGLFGALMAGYQKYASQH